MFDKSTHILLTGGTGFFGRSLLRHLSDMGDESPQITILSRNPQKFRQQYPNLAPLVHWVEGDILKPESLPYLGKYTHIIHGAADSTLGHMLTPIERYIQIVDGTKNLLELAVKTGSRRFLLISSGAVYGPQPQYIKKIIETYNGMPDPMQPKYAYGVAKRCAEHLCILYQNKYDIETVVGRCFAFVGCDLPMKAHFAVGNFIRDAIQSNEIIVNGDGSAIRSYLDQRDLIRWLLALLEQGQPGEAYNVGSDQEISIKDLAYLVRDLVSPNKTVRILGKHIDRNGQDRYVPDVTKICQGLGVNVGISLGQSIMDTANALAEPKNEII